MNVVHMDTQHTSFVSGWTHYCFEQESIFMNDLLLKFPQTTGESLPRIEKLSVHWSAPAGQYETMMKVRAAFFLCTGHTLQVTRARKDNARFSLRQGVPLGLQGKLPLQFLSFLQASASNTLHTLPSGAIPLHQEQQLVSQSTETIPRSFTPSSVKAPYYGANVNLAVRKHNETTACGGLSDLYAIESLQAFHEFFGPLPGWEWRVRTTTQNSSEAKVLCSVWKIEL